MNTEKNSTLVPDLHPNKRDLMEACHSEVVVATVGVEGIVAAEATVAQATMVEQEARRTAGLTQRRWEAVVTRDSARQRPRLTHRTINTITGEALSDTRPPLPLRLNQKHFGGPTVPKALSLTLKEAVNHRVDTRALPSKATQDPC